MVCVCDEEGEFCRCREESVGAENSGILSDSLGEMKVTGGWDDVLCKVWVSLGALMLVGRVKALKARERRLDISFW